MAVDPRERVGGDMLELERDPVLGLLLRRPGEGWMGDRLGRRAAAGKTRPRDVAGPGFGYMPKVLGSSLSKISRRYKAAILASSYPVSATSLVHFWISPR